MIFSEPSFFLLLSADFNETSEFIYKIIISVITDYAAAGDLSKPFK